MDISISNRELVNILLNSEKKDSTIVQGYISKKYQLPPQVLQSVGKKLNQFFLPIFRKKWKNSFYVESNFFINNEKWLDNSFIISSPKKNLKKKKSFEKSSYSTKKGTLNEIFEEIPTSELLNASLKRESFFN